MKRLIDDPEIGSELQAEMRRYASEQAEVDLERAYANLDASLQLTAAMAAPQARFAGGAWSGLSSTTKLLLVAAIGGTTALGVTALRGEERAARLPAILQMSPAAATGETPAQAVSGRTTASASGGTALRGDGRTAPLPDTLQTVPTFGGASLRPAQAASGRTTEALAVGAAPVRSAEHTATLQTKPSSALGIAQPGGEPRGELQAKAAPTLHPGDAHTAQLPGSLRTNHAPTGGDQRAAQAARQAETARAALNQASPQAGNAVPSAASGSSPERRTSYVPAGSATSSDGARQPQLGAAGPSSAGRGRSGAGSASRREIAQLARIKALLPENPAAARRLIRAAQREFPAGLLVEEREGLDVIALFALAENERARANAERFVARYPHSPLRPKLERLIAGAGE